MNNTRKIAEALITGVVRERALPKVVEGTEHSFAVGDKVRYYPRWIEDDRPENGTITKFVAAGNIFNQDMAVIDTVDHWVPASDLVKDTGDRLTRNTPPANGTITKFEAADMLPTNKTYLIATMKTVLTAQVQEFFAYLRGKGYSGCIVADGPGCENWAVACPSLEAARALTLSCMPAKYSLCGESAEGVWEDRR